MEKWLQIIALEKRSAELENDSAKWLSLDRIQGQIEDKQAESTR